FPYTPLFRSTRLRTVGIEADGVCDAFEESLLFAFVALDLDSGRSRMTAATERRGDRRDINVLRHAAHRDTPTCLVLVQQGSGPGAFGPDQEVDHPFGLAALCPALLEHLGRQLGPNEIARPLHTPQRSAPETDRGLWLQPEQCIHDRHRVRAGGDERS